MTNSLGCVVEQMLRAGAVCLLSPHTKHYTHLRVKYVPLHKVPWLIDELTGGTDERMDGRTYGWMDKIDNKEMNRVKNMFFKLTLACLF